MKWEELCTDLDLSIKLRELGVKQESFCFWVNLKEDDWFLLKEPRFSKPFHPDNISAFTSDELLKILPKYIDTKTNEPFNNFRFYMQRFVMIKDLLPTDTFLINYLCDTHPAEANPLIYPYHLMKNIWDEKLSNALAKTLIYLIERRLVEVHSDGYLHTNPG